MYEIKGHTEENAEQPPIGFAFGLRNKRGQNFSEGGLYFILQGISEAQLLLMSGPIAKPQVCPKV